MIALQALRPMPCFQDAITYLLDLFPEFARPYTSDPDYLLATFFSPMYGPKYFKRLAGDTLKGSVKQLPVYRTPKPQPPSVHLPFVSGVQTTAADSVITGELRTRKMAMEERIRNAVPQNVIRPAKKNQIIPLTKFCVMSYDEVVALARSRLPDIRNVHLPRPPVPEPRNDESEDLFDFQLDSSGDESETRLTLNQELDKYIQLTQDGNATKDTILFWKQQKQKLPLLNYFVRIFFTKAVSTASVERMFSSVGHMNARTRTNIKIETLEARQLYKENIKNRDKELAGGGSKVTVSSVEVIRHLQENGLQIEAEAEKDAEIQDAEEQEELFDENLFELDETVQ